MDLSISGIRLLLELFTGRALARLKLAMVGAESWWHNLPAVHYASNLSAWLIHYSSSLSGRTSTNNLEENSIQTPRRSIFKLAFNQTRGVASSSPGNGYLLGICTYRRIGTANMGVANTTSCVYLGLQSHSRATVIHLIAASGLKVLCAELLIFFLKKQLPNANSKDDVRRTPIM